MRAWKMTVGLALAAILAALVAPRLLASAPQPAVNAHITVPPVSVANPVTPATPATPTTPAIPELKAIPMKPARRAVIRPRHPVLPVAPPTPVVEPDPTLEEHWMDMVDCGMG